jgi:hypothetical protein
MVSPAAHAPFYCAIVRRSDFGPMFTPLRKFGHEGQDVRL